MNLKIESDGTPHGTRVLTERGEPIEGITHIEWSVDVHHRAEAKITLRGVWLDFEGEIPTTISKEHTL